MRSQYYISKRQRDSTERVAEESEGVRKKTRSSNGKEPINQRYVLDGTQTMEEDPVIYTEETKDSGRPKGAFNEPLSELFVGSSEQFMNMIKVVERHSKKCEGSFTFRRRDIKTKGLMLQAKTACSLGIGRKRFADGKRVFKTLLVRRLDSQRKERILKKQREAVDLYDPTTRSAVEEVEQS